MQKEIDKKKMTYNLFVSINNFHNLFLQILVEQVNRNLTGFLNNHKFIFFLGSHQISSTSTDIHSSRIQK